MNEQITQLAKQAGARFGAEGTDYSSFASSKFAELIVRECVSVVENLSPGYVDYRNQIEDAFRRDCVEEIKYHFGIQNL